MINRLHVERPHLIVIAGDFYSRTSQWWIEDAESSEGLALDEIIEVNDLYQLIDELTGIRGASMSCIDLVITDQLNLFVESGVHPS